MSEEAQFVKRELLGLGKLFCPVVGQRMLYDYGIQNGSSRADAIGNTAIITFWVHLPIYLGLGYGFYSLLR